VAPGARPSRDRPAPLDLFGSSGYLNVDHWISTLCVSRKYAQQRQYGKQPDDQRHQTQQQTTNDSSDSAKRPEQLDYIVRSETRDDYECKKPDDIGGHDLAPGW
jgi:hypothetical protein